MHPFDFSKYLTRWDLIPDGNPIITSSSRLLPVRQGHTPAMLKVAIAQEEKIGGSLMAWWDGQGAAKILAYQDDALIMERAENANSLIYLSSNGQDDEASRIICSTIARLHEPRTLPYPHLTDLTDWFRKLQPMSEIYGGIMRFSAAMAKDLLATQQDMVVLHGDIHHGNILDFGAQGWLAIDPKGLYGDRCFDYANIFCNPDDETATTSGLLARRVELISKTAEY